MELLAMAVKLEGSKQAVATLLHVPERTFDRWLDGRAQMPEKLTKALMELIANRVAKPQSN
jgi:DNA-binding transcriptional regulator YiaG